MGGESAAVFNSSASNRRARLSEVAKIVNRKGRQFVSLPPAFRFDSAEILVRRDPHNGDLILSSKPTNWDSFLLAIQDLDIDLDFLAETERSQDEQSRDPFSDGCE